MTRRTLSRSSSLWMTMIGLATLVVPAALHAQATSGTRVFFACYVPNTGTTYRIKEVDLKQECSSSKHVQFSWFDGNPAAFSAVVTALSQVSLVQPGSKGVAVAKCPAGFKAAGGGFVFPQAAINPIRVAESLPLAGNEMWAVTAFNPDTVEIHPMQAIAQCVK